MKYQVGDKILVLHSNEEGEIIDIINDKMVLVDVRGGPEGQSIAALRVAGVRYVIVQRSGYLAGD